MTRILLVDDHAAFRQPLRFFLERDPEFTVVAQAGSLTEARGMMEGIDVAIVDLDLPDGDGAEFVDDLRTTDPQVRTLVLTADDDRKAHARAVEAGAAGVLHKTVLISDVVDGVHRLLAGESLLSQNETIELLRLADREREQNKEAQWAIESLTPREREVLQALADGLSDKEIAERLYVGSGTVRNHVMSILRKLDVHSRLQALVFAVHHGAVEID